MPLLRSWGLMPALAKKNVKFLKIAKCCELSLRFSVLRTASLMEKSRVSAHCKLFVEFSNQFITGNSGIKLQEK